MQKDARGLWSYVRYSVLAGVLCAGLGVGVILWQKPSVQAEGNEADPFGGVTASAPVGHALHEWWSDHVAPADKQVEDMAAAGERASVSVKEASAPFPTPPPLIAAEVVAGQFPAVQITSALEERMQRVSRMLTSAPLPMEEEGGASPALPSAGRRIKGAVTAKTSQLLQGLNVAVDFPAFCSGLGISGSWETLDLNALTISASGNMQLFQHNGIPDYAELLLLEQGLEDTSFLLNGQLVERWEAIEALFTPEEGETVIPSVHRIALCYCVLGDSSVILGAAAAVSGNLNPSEEAPDILLTTGPWPMSCWGDADDDGRCNLVEWNATSGENDFEDRCGQYLSKALDDTTYPAGTWYDITCTSDGNALFLPPTVQVAAGESISLHAIPVSPWAFQEWQTGGAPVTANPLLLTNVTAAATVHAVFETDPDAGLWFEDMRLEQAVRVAVNKLNGCLRWGDVLDGKLLSLDASGLGISDLDGVENLIELTSLNLYDNQITRITPLRRLETLQELNLGHNEITAITDLEGLTSLSYLELGEKPVVQDTDITAPPEQGNLITDISPLASLTALWGLGISGNAVTDLSPLSQLSQLELLLVDGNPVTDLSPLFGLTRLVALGLGDLGLTDSVLAGVGQTPQTPLFAHWPDLFILLLSDNPQVTGLTGLSNCAGLVGLVCLNCTSLEDISELETLSHLGILSISQSQVEDISSLADLAGGEGTIWLPGNQISGIAPLAASGLFQSQINLEDNPLTQDDVCVQIPLIQAVDPAVCGCAAAGCCDNVVIHNAVCGPAHLLTTAVTPAGAGSVSPFLGARPVAANSAVQVTALQTNPDYVFESWEGEASGTDPVVTVNMTEDRDVTALFGAGDYTLTMLEPWGAGEVTPAPGAWACRAGEERCLSAQGKPGWAFAYWYTTDANNNVLGQTWDANHCVEMNENTTLQAEFFPANVTLTLGNYGRGSLFPPVGRHYYLFWDEVTVEQDPNDGWFFRMWYGNFQSTDPFVNVVMTQDYSLYAWFVIFPDPHLEQAVFAAINKPYGLVYPEDLAGITVFTADNCQITSLTGMEWWTDLEELSLNGNPGGQDGLDLGPLAGLTSLRVLSLDETSPKLESLEGLAALPALETLSLVECGLTDAEPLESFPALATLHLENNQLTDLTPLIANTALGNGDYLYLAGNPIPEEVLCGQVAQLTARGVVVDLAGECRYTLTTQTQGGGTVAKQPDAADYLPGTAVALTATPTNAATTHFDHWEMDGQSAGTQNPLTVTMDADKTVKAVFEPHDFTLTVQVEGNGTVTPAAGTHYYLTDAVVDFIVAPAEGWMLDHWEGDLSGSAHTAQLIMNQNHFVKAIFSEGTLKANFTATPTPTQGLTPFTVQFTDSSAWRDDQITAWSWDFGDGASSTQQNPSHEYTMEGTYTVGLSVAAGTPPQYESVTKSNMITVYGLPEAVFTAIPPTGPAPLTVRFTNQSNLHNAPTATYAWDFGDGATGTSASPTHRYMQEGSYAVTLSVTTLGGMDIEQSTITVTKLPEAAFLVTPLLGTVGEEGLTVYFTDQSTATPPDEITSWEVDFGDGTPVVEFTQAPSAHPHVYEKAGTFTVSLTVISDAGSNKCVKRGHVVVTELPSAAFSANPRSGPAPLTVSFSAPASIGGTEQAPDDVTAFEWAFGDGTTQTVTTPSTTHQYTTPGVYTVVLKATTESSTVFTKTWKNCVRARRVQPVAPQPEGSFGEEFEELIPEDTVLDAYNPDRFAVVEGLVTDMAGTPLNGVEVSVRGRPEYGTAVTAPDENGENNGVFRLPVEGGGAITLAYELDGYLKSHRRVKTAWNEVSSADTVELLAREVDSTVMNAGGETEQVFTHTGGEVSDTFGDRACTIVMEDGPENEVFEVDADGNRIRKLTELTVRTTEYATEASMPATLPRASAYTYCVELSVDGAEYVEFTKPVVFFVDNFLGFPVGESVPLGAYDREKGDWVAEKDGVVVELLDLNSDGVVDGIDATGDGAPDNFDGDELAGLLEDTVRFQPGRTYWRMEASHFSPHDCNWAASGPPGCRPPIPATKGGSDKGPDPTDPPCGTPTGCYVTHQGRVYHDDVSIPGVAGTLHYASDRSDAYVQNLWVATGSTNIGAADKLKRIEVIVRTPGGPRKKVIYPEDYPESEMVSFEFSRNDRRCQWLGPQGVPVEVVNVYQSFPWTTRGTQYAGISFGETGVYPWYGTAAGSVRQDIRLVLNTNTVPAVFACHPGSVTSTWTLSNHHYHPSPTSPYMIRGDGSVATVRPYKISGTSSGAVSLENPGGILDILRNETVEYTPYRVCADRAGNVYFVSYHTNASTVWRIDRTGVLSHFAGDGVDYDWDGTDRNDGEPATLAGFDFISDITADDEGNLYIVDSRDQTIRRVDRNGIISTFAGALADESSEVCRFCDGAPHFCDHDCGEPRSGCVPRFRLAVWMNPERVTCDHLGNVYYTESYGQAVFRIDQAGNVRLVAGNPYERGAHQYDPQTDACELIEPDPLVDGASALPTAIFPVDIAVDENGDLFFINLEEGVGPGRHSIWRMDSSGILHLEYAPPAGFSYPFYQDEQAERCLAFDQADTLHFFQGGSLVRLNRSDGTASEVVPKEYANASFGLGAGYSGVCFDAQNTLHIITNPFESGTLPPSIGRKMQKRIYRWSEITNQEELALFTDDTGTGYQFDRRGRHLQTVNLLTGTVLAQFIYVDDRSPLLSEMAEGRGNILTIVRDTSDRPTALVSKPAGSGSTEWVTVNLEASGGDIAVIEYPDGGRYDFQYNGETGQMVRETVNTTVSDHHITYDDKGKVVQVNDATAESAFEFTESVEEDGACAYTAIQPDGQTEVKVTEAAALTGETTRSVTNEAGLTASTTRSPDGMTTVTTTPDGMTTTVEYANDPEHGGKYPRTVTRTIGEGAAALSNTIVYDRTYEKDQGTVTQVTTTQTLSSPTSPALLERTMTLVNDQDVGTLTATVAYVEGATPVDRELGIVYYETNPERVTEVETPLGRVTYTYDEGSKLLTAVTQHEAVENGGERVVALEHDGPLNRLSRVEGPDGASMTFGYDPVGRMNSAVSWSPQRTDPSMVSLTHDVTGNVAAVADSANNTHRFTHDGWGRVRSYAVPGAPEGGAYTYLYEEGRLVEAASPGATHTFAYDQGRLVSVTSPDVGATTLEYGETTGLLESVSRAGGQDGASLEYLGPLPVSLSLSGPLSATLDVAYNAYFQPVSVAYAGASEGILYDGFGAPSHIGVFDILRDPDSGRVDAVQETGRAGYSMEYDYTGYGEVAGTVLKLNSLQNNTQKAALGLVYDDAGALAGKTESFDGTAPRSLFYAYDHLGGLLTVHDDTAQLLESYHYDVAGRRIAGNGRAYAYEADGRLKTAGTVAYNYDPDGQLVVKVDGPQETAYFWNSLGQMTGVVLPDATPVTYTYNVLGQRVAKSVDGVVVEKYLWGGVNQQLLAVLDASDAVVARFEYAGGRMPVAMVQGGDVYYLAYDQVGSLRAVYTALGDVVRTVEYDAWGKILSESPPATGHEGLNVPFGFAGGLHDRDTGLVLFGLRNYDPETGRWTSRDPIGLAGGDTDLYAYCANDPVGKVDPTGLEECGIAVDESGGGFVRVSVSIGVGVIPLVGTGQSLVEFATGYDYIAGESSNRFFSGIGIIAGVFPGGKAVVKGGVKGVTAILPDVRKFFRTGTATYSEIHHIVAKAAKGAARSREILLQWGVDIQDAGNLVVLPVCERSLFRGVTHRGLHTKEYYKKVEKILSDVTSYEDLVARLEEIAANLIDGVF